MKLVLAALMLTASTIYGQSNDYSGYLNSSGVEIYYRVFGSGDPLLIINGGPGMSSEGFVPLAKQLAQGRQTIIFDQRGTGKSKVTNPSNETITMDLMIADMEALREHLNLKKWSILGHSFGGMLASYYTSRYPERVDGVIFSSSGGPDLDLFSYINITGRLTQIQRDSLQFWDQQIASGDTSYNARFRRGMQLAPAYLFQKKFVPAIADRLTQGNLNVNTLVFQDLRKIEFDCRTQLSAYQGAALIIQGADDIIELRTAKRTQEALPQAEIVLLENCGHYGWLDQKEQYFEEVNSFLNQI